MYLSKVDRVVFALAIYGPLETHQKKAREERSWSRKNKKEWTQKSVIMIALEQRTIHIKKAKYLEEQKN